MRNVNNNADTFVETQAVKKFSDVVRIERKTLREIIKPYLTNQANTEPSSIWGSVFKAANFLSDPFGPSFSFIEEPTIDSFNTFWKHWTYPSITDALNKLDRELSKSNSEILNDKELIKVIIVILDIKTTYFNFPDVFDTPLRAAFQFFTEKVGSVIMYKQLADFLTEKFSAEAIEGWKILLEAGVGNDERLKILVLYKENIEDLVKIYLISKRKDSVLDMLDDFAQAQSFLNHFTTEDIKIISKYILEINQNTHLSPKIYREIFLTRKHRPDELEGVIKVVIPFENFLRSLPYDLECSLLFSHEFDINVACRTIFDKSVHLTKLSIAFAWLYKTAVSLPDWCKKGDIIRFAKIIINHAQIADQLVKLLAALCADKTISGINKRKIFKVIYEQRLINIQETMPLLGSSSDLIKENNQLFFLQDLINILLVLCEKSEFNQTSLNFLVVSLMSSFELKLSQLDVLFPTGLSVDQLESFINILEAIDTPWAKLTLGLIYSGDLLVNQSVSLYSQNSSKQKKQCLQLARQYLEPLLEDENYRVEAAKVLVKLYHSYGEFPAYWRMHCILYNAAKIEKDINPGSEIVRWTERNSIVGKVKLNYKFPCSFFQSMNSIAERNLYPFMKEEQKRDEKAIVIYKRAVRL